jgi:hypothetical protein
MDAATLLLTAAFHHTINEPNIESGFARFVELVGQDVDFESFCDAVAASLRDGLIREPVRLPEGALQCHWYLELTPKGVATARTLLAGRATLADIIPGHVTPNKPSNNESDPQSLLRSSRSALRNIVDTARDKN